MVKLVFLPKMGRSCYDSLVPKHAKADIEQERRRVEEEEDSDGDVCMNDRWQMELSGFPNFANLWPQHDHFKGWHFSPNVSWAASPTSIKY